MPRMLYATIPYGIQNPGFLQNLKGGCDTRTNPIYSVLKYFNYDVAILNSDFIDIPSSVSTGRQWYLQNLTTGKNT